MGSGADNPKYLVIVFEKMFYDERQHVHPN
jgi:hypothetical protein